MMCQKLICEIEKTPGKLQEKNAKAGTTPVEVKADAGFYGLSKVNIDAIKLQEKSVNVQSEAQDVVADDDYTALSRVSVAGYPTQEKTITIKNDAVIEPDPGFKAMTKVGIKVDAGMTYSDYVDFITFDGPRNVFKTEKPLGNILGAVAVGKYSSRFDHLRILDIRNVTRSDELILSNADWGDPPIAPTIQKLRTGEMVFGGWGPQMDVFSLKEIYCSPTKIIDFQYHEYISEYDSFTSFNVFQKLIKIIIDSPKFISCGTIEGLLQIPAFTSGAGKIYVKDDLVDEYKKARNWITVADHIRPLSEYEAAGGWNYDFYPEEGNAK